MKGTAKDALTLFFRVFFLKNSGRSFATSANFMRRKEQIKLCNETVRCPNPIFLNQRAEKIAVGHLQRDALTHIFDRNNFLLLK